MSSCARVDDDWLSWVTMSKHILIIIGVEQEYRESLQNRHFVLRLVSQNRKDNQLAGNDPRLVEKMHFLPKYFRDWES